MTTSKSFKGPHIRIAPRHLVRILISPEMLVDMFSTRESIQIKTDGLPKGSKFYGFYFDPDTGCICMAVEHESFAPVEDGAQIPQFRVHQELTTTMSSPTMPPPNQKTCGLDISQILYLKVIYEKLSGRQAEEIKQGDLSPERFIHECFEKKVISRV